MALLGWPAFEGLSFPNVHRRVLENLHVDVEGFDGVQNQSSECWLEA